MKELIVLSMLLPLFSFAQDAPENVKSHHSKNEITLNTGLNFQPENDFKNMNNGDLRLSVGYVRNFNQLQAGVRFEMTSDFLSYIDYTPAVIVNKKFKLHKSYLYAGTAVGYFQRANNVFGFMPGQNLKGYMLGIQGGAAFHLSNSFSLTTELAIRSAQTWYKDYYYEPPFTSAHGSYDGFYYEVIQTQFILSFPVSVGVVYRF